VSFQRANNYWFEDHEGKLRGTIRLLPGGAAQGELAIDDLVSNKLEVQPGDLGLVVSAAVRLMADGDKVLVVAVLPRVNADPRLEAEPFHGVGLVLTKRNTIGGTSLVRGPLETYDLRALHGAADVVP
jgi:hypothetical protein